MPPSARLRRASLLGTKRLPAPILMVVGDIGRNTLYYTDGPGSSGPAYYYNLYKSQVSGFIPGPGNFAGSLSAGPQSDTDVIIGTGYFYRLAAVGPAGEGEYSAEVMGTPQANPTLSLSAIIAVAEGSAGAPGTFTLNGTRSSNVGAASATWTVSAGFGVNPIDLADAGGSWPTGTISWAPGNYNATATYQLAGDANVEPDETGLVTLSSPSSPFVIGTSSQPFLVVNDDTYPTMSLGVITPRAEGSSAFPAIVNIPLTRSVTTGIATCDWAVTAGTGPNPLSPSDFAGGVFPSGTATWADGAANPTGATFTMLGESNVEFDETGLVTISNPSSGYIIGTAQQPFTILDDDAVQPLVNPLIAGFGGSRVRQAGNPSGSTGPQLNCNHVTGGMLTWIQALDPRYRFTDWDDQTSTKNNPFNMNGMIFASDGEGFTQMRTRVPKLNSSRANIVMMDLSSNSINGPFDVPGYLNQAKELVTLMRAAGKIVGVLSLVERGSGTGGPWGLFQQWRLAVPSINSQMKTWCEAQQGVFFVDIRSVLVNLTDPAHEPLAKFRGDPYDATRDNFAPKYAGTHWSARGAYEATKVWIAAAAPYIAASGEASRAISANLIPNPVMTGSVAVPSQSNLSGVAPTSYGVSYGTSYLSNVTVSKVDLGGGKFGTKLSINRSAMATDGSKNALILSVSAGAPSLTSGKWYTAGCKASTNSAPGLASIACTEFADSTTKTVRGLCGIDPSGTSTAYGIEDLAAEAVTVKSETPNLKALANGTSTYKIYTCWGRGDGSTLEITLFDPFIIETEDGRNLLFDASDTSTPSITSPATFTFPEESTFIAQGVSTKPGYWSITGADAALMQITTFGELKPRSPFDYEAPTDADTNSVYEANMVLTPFDYRDSAVTKAVSITITNIDDGFTDNFNRAAGTSLGAEGNWTPVQQNSGGGFSTNDLQVASDGNRVSSVTVGTATKFSNRLAPQQFKDGNPNYEQRIRFFRGVGNSTAFPNMFVQYKDYANYISVQADTAGFLSLWRNIAGTRQKIATYAYEDLYGVDFIVQRLGTEIQVFQGGVRLTPATGSEVVGTILQDAYFSGVGSFGPGTFFFDVWNNRNATPLVSKIGLKKLTIDAAYQSIGFESAAIDGIPVNNLMDGSTRKIQAVSGTGLFANVIADGNFVRIQNGIAGETYTITLNEILADAAPSAGRDSVLAQITLTADRVGLPTGYTVTFVDNFTTLDTATWKVYPELGRSNKGWSDAYSGGYAFYADPAYGWSNSFTPFSIGADGLTITARRRTLAPTFGAGEVPDRTTGNPYPYVSGALQAKGALSMTGNFAFGWLGTDPVGKGAWPARWALSSRPFSKAEIDTFEGPSHLGASQYWVNVHEGDGTEHGLAVAIANRDTVPQKYVTEVSDTFVKHYLNGTLVQTIDITDKPEFQEGIYPIMNVEVGSSLGSWVPAPDGTSPDYFRQSTSQFIIGRKAGPTSLKIPNVGVLENAATGAAVGTPVVTNYGGNTAYTFAKTLDPDAKFAVAASGGAVTTTAALPAFTTKYKTSVSITVTDGNSKTWRNKIVIPILSADIGVTNLFTNGNALGAGWDLYGVDLGTAGNYPDAAGGTTGQFVRELATNENHCPSQQVTVPTAAALYYLEGSDLRPNGRDWILIEVGNAYATPIKLWFNITTGEVGQYYANDATQISIVDVFLVKRGNSFYRPIVVFQKAAGITTIRMSEKIVMYDGDVDTHLGDITKGFYSSTRYRLFKYT